MSHCLDQADKAEQAGGGEAVAEVAFGGGERAGGRLVGTIPEGIVQGVDFNRVPQSGAGTMGDDVVDICRIQPAGVID